MRLLHSTTLQLSEFFGENIPPYAILSHTWGEDEVSFQEMLGEPDVQKAGYVKIKRCCDMAVSDGFEYVWVDTCCIDKTSSAELSEAINSMYEWYEFSEVCYVILSDVPSMECNPFFMSADFRKCRWFTRGWTLQELIAPASIIFFNGDWIEIGTKLSLLDKISEITGIHLEILTRTASLDGFSIAQKMSWASKRTTTRIEDIAYSLFGIFRINMPMLYGEGPRAFIRLQEEILKISDDQSIFAWAETSRINSRETKGLLASDPHVFLDTQHIIQTRKDHARPYALTNMGICLTVPMGFKMSYDIFRGAADAFGAVDGDEGVALLNCCDSRDSSVVGIYLQRCMGKRDEYKRMRLRERKMCKEDDFKFPLTTIYVKDEPLRGSFHPKASVRDRVRFKIIDLENHKHTAFDIFPASPAWPSSSTIPFLIPSYWSTPTTIYINNRFNKPFAVGIWQDYGETRLETTSLRVAITGCVGAAEPYAGIEQHMFRIADRLTWHCPSGLFSVQVNVRRQMADGQPTITLEVIGLIQD